mmetsp:Transcript_28262/g.74570  ORF Transcript_28262/g.74570 Transcript_28262/m.74570 type:complete len:300 (-) Transcript_28262:542-1441(-)
MFSLCIVVTGTGNHIRSILGIGVVSTQLQLALFLVHFTCHLRQLADRCIQDLLPRPDMFQRPVFFVKSRDLILASNADLPHFTDLFQQVSFPYLALLAGHGHLLTHSEDHALGSLDGLRLCPLPRVVILSYALGQRRLHRVQGCFKRNLPFFVASFVVLQNVQFLLELLAVSIEETLQGASTHFQLLGSANRLCDLDRHSTLQGVHRSCEPTVVMAYLRKFFFVYCQRVLCRYQRRVKPVELQLIFPTRTLAVIGDPRFQDVQTLQHLLIQISVLQLAGGPEIIDITAQMGFEGFNDSR